MRDNSLKRLLALLLCLVMLTAQLGMTSFEAEEDHDHDPVLVQDTAAPAEESVPGEQAEGAPETAEQPADGDQDEAEEPGPVEGGPGDDLPGDDETAGGVTEDAAPAGDEQTGDGDETDVEPEANEGGETEANEGGETETDGEPELGEQPGGEEQSEEDGPEAVTMSLDTPVPIAAPRASAPTITVAMPAGQNKTDGTNYCTTPTVTVRGTGDITVTVNGDAQQTLHDGESVVLGAGKESGWGVTYDIAATNEGGSASKHIFVGHGLGGRSTIKYAPTCTEAGRTMTYWKCDNCGQYWHGYSGTTGESALGHTHDPAQEKVLEGECGGSGGVKVAPCTRCGVLVKEDNTEYKDEGTGHEWEEKTKPATCTESGYKYKECAKCHAQVFIEKINATGHQLGKWEMESLEGKKCGDIVTRTLHCQNCDYAVTERTQIQHVWSNKRTTIKEATCTEQGQTGFACTRDGCTEATGIQYTPALGHDYSKTGDCTKPGECSRCHTMAPVLEHKFEKYESDGKQHWQVCSNEGCTVTGERQDHVNVHAGDCTKAWRCSVCQHSVTGEADHDWKWVDLGNGTHEQKCQNENCTQVRNAAAHRWNIPNDCTKDKTCLDCGATQPAEKEHTYGPWSRFTTYHVRSCTNPGCKVQERADHQWKHNEKDCTANVECTVCGEVLLFGALNHNFASSPWYPDADGAHHHQECENKNCEAVGPSQAHTGGTATCTNSAVCEVCHTPYGATDPSNHESRKLVGYKAATNEVPGYSGNIVCTACNTVLEEGSVIPSGQQSCPHDNVVSKYDDNGSWEECTNCHVQLNYKTHVFNGKYLSDGDEHWQQCENCQHTTAKAPHVLGDDDYDNNCTTPVECDVCGKVLVEAKTHNYNGAWVIGWTGSSAETAKSQHARACSNDDCKSIGTYSDHRVTEDNDCTTPAVCADCGYEIVKAQEHVWDEVWHYDEAARPGVHYQQCLNLEGKCTAVKEEPHQPLPDDGDCTTPVLCAVCGAVVVEGETEHDFGGAYLSDETGHWQECRNEGCGHESQEEDHTGGKATCVEAAVCDVCGRHYGEPDPANHVVGGEEIVGHVNPTLEAPGYSGDVKCVSCGQVKTPGWTLDQLDKNQEAHVWSEYRWDAVKHWRECTGGCGTWSEEAPHSVSYEKNSEGHRVGCVCGYGNEGAFEPHVWGPWQHDETGHWRVCTECGYATPLAGHAAAADAVWQHDETSHWRLCAACGEPVDRAEHTYDPVGVCDVCGAEDPNFVVPVKPDAGAAANSAAAAETLKDAVQSLPEGDPLMDKVLVALERGAKEITVALEVDEHGVTGSSKTVDIEIAVYADSEKLGNIDHVASPIAFTISLDGLNGRVIRVLRAHEGSGTVEIPSSVSVTAAGRTVTFSSDLFSTFTIEASNDISHAAVSDIPDQTYTGSAIKPAVTVTVNGGEKLTEGVDYTVSYGTNIEGTGTVTITGIGDFEGTSLTKTFNIVKPAAKPADGKVPTSPQTGDETPLALYGTMAALCAAALALVLVRRRKEQ